MEVRQGPPPRCRRQRSWERGRARAAQQQASYCENALKVQPNRGGRREKPHAREAVLAQGGQRGQCPQRARLQAQRPTQQADDREGQHWWDRGALRDGAQNRPTQTQEQRSSPNLRQAWKQEDAQRGPAAWD